MRNFFKNLILLFIMSMFLFVGCSTTGINNSESQEVILKITARTTGYMAAKKYPEFKPVAQEFCDRFMKIDSEDAGQALLALGIEYFFDEFGDEDIIIKNFIDLLTLVDIPLIEKSNLSSLNLENLELEQMKIIVGAFCEGVNM